MIDNPVLEDILETATDITKVCEFYSPDAEPSINGFDPADALACFAPVKNIYYRGRSYKRLVKDFGAIKRTINDEINSSSVDLSNVSKEVVQFDATYGFEGLILVVRLLSRNLSHELTESQTLFAGRCDKPDKGTKNIISISARSVLDSPSVTIPRRRFVPDDYKGRDPADPEFEGFKIMPKEGNLTYSTRKKKGGIAGWFGLKKTVVATLHYSTYSNIDVNRYLPEVIGYAQIVLTHLGWFDAGTHLQIRSAACEGPIADFINTRSIDSTLPLDASSYAEQLGLVGAANGDDPSWVAGGYFYSRTALIRGQIDNSAMDVTDEAPDVVSIIKGRLLLTPDAEGNWVTTQWTDNAAAAIFYLMCGSSLGPDYYALGQGWIHKPSFKKVYDYNGEAILDPSSSDFLFLE
jgi:hypothetical protein